MEEIKEEFYNLLEQNINQIAQTLKQSLEISMQKLVKKAYTNPPLAMKVYTMKLTITEQK